eukprot:TRINITY_DN49168_c0_g3_i1.p4 TRINITY_DN49168_c0_g3~~TRINITY_DN49168_c0_g3_i1.p4  ORF type:complete len:121 (-),score=7.79 TRINITY_DN49168_c0_g3_i1:538-900(-)
MVPAFPLSNDGTAATPSSASGERAPRDPTSFFHIPFGGGGERLCAGLGCAGGAFRPFVCNGSSLGGVRLGFAGAPVVILIVAADADLGNGNIGTTPPTPCIGSDMVPELVVVAVVCCFVK